LLASLLYLALRRLIALVLLRPRSSEFKELEIVVLRHELAGAAWAAYPPTAMPTSVTWACTMSRQALRSNGSA
jgi:hypothetical protein